MMVLVIGGSGSGKSSYAEEAAVLLSRGDGMRRYYLATMRVWDEEGRRKVERHRELRSGKGFLTVEQPVHIERALMKMEPGKKAVLLECISNLTANEMFSGEGKAGMDEEAQTGERITDGIRRLKESVTHLVVVSNNVFEDGVIYDELTMGYIRVMGKINRELAKMADQVVEAAAGIPVFLKR